MVEPPVSAKQEVEEEEDAEDDDLDIPAFLRRQAN